MLKSITVAVFLFYNVLFVYGESMIGPGVWKVYHISYLKGTINDIVIDLKQSRIDRSLYGYNGKLDIHEPLDESLGMKMDICKYVDGGCKQFQVLSDDSFVAFANKFAEEDIKKCFEMIGIDPPSLPLAPGEYDVENFVFDASSLPDECTYGRFIAEACAMRGTMPVGCITAEVEFMEKEECDEEDEDDCEE